MATLGPVIGTIGGGGAEVVTEQVTVSAGQTRTFTMPAGWTAGYIGAEGAVTAGTYDDLNGEVLGSVRLGQFRDNDDDLRWGGFISLSSVARIVMTEGTWTGTVTFIRTA